MADLHLFPLGPGSQRPLFKSTYGPDTKGLKLCNKTLRRYAAEKRSHDEKVDKETTAFAKFLLAQWPRQKPTVEGHPRTSLMDISKAMEHIFPEWLRLFQNSELSTYLDQV